MKTLRRSLFLLLALLAFAPGAWAQLPDFITDVLVIGHNDQTYLQVYETLYTNQGYTAIHYNLNAGCTGGDFIHLLYKKQSSLNSSGTPITDFYIKTGSNPPDSLTHEGRTYHLVPCNGSTNFVNSKGDLNRGAGGAYIYLYYTKDPMTVERSVTGITFNTTQSGGVGANGDNTTGYDLNSGAGGDYIYMHVATNKIPITLTAESEEVQLEDGDILNGTGGADTRVTIAAGATVTLAGVTITDIPDDNDHQWAGIGCLGDAVIILADGTTNTVKGGRRYPSIHVPVGQTLTLEGGGTLNASGSHAAGLGSGYYVSCGNINIAGGIVNATGDDGAAGIGSGYTTGNIIGGIYSDSNCGNITISGGTVTATGGNNAAGIGSGTSDSQLYYSVCGNITISGGTVTATGGNNAAGIGGGMIRNNFGTITITNGVTRVTAIKGEDNNYSIGPGRHGTFGTIIIGDVVTNGIGQSPFVTYPYTVIFDANGGSGTMDDMHLMNDVAQYLTPNSFTNEGLWFFGWATTPDGEIVYSNGHSVSHMTETSGGTVTLYAKWSTASIVSLTPQTGDLELQDGDILIGTGGPDTRLTIADGATVTFSGVHITTIPNNSSYQWAAVTCLGDATIILDQTNEVVGGYYRPGVVVAPDKTLTLQGLGTLNATGRHGSAGIGSSGSSPCGNIVIQSGNINAAGTNTGAGIGGRCGDITISGGTVNAIGGGSGTGIGSGSSSDEGCGDITISGGTVNATGGAYGGAGIGSSGHGACGDITISGGTVNATGGYSDAGIGSGSNGSYGDITITNDVTRVTAIKGQNCSSSIGSGKYWACGTITIGGVATGEITQSPFTTFPYTVSFDANGGTGTMNDQVFMYNVAQSLIANSFTHGSLSFIGWATSAEGPKVYNNGQSVSNLADTIATVTLYAKWRLQHVMLTSSTGEMLLQDGDTLSGTGGPDTHVTIADGATVTLSGVDITSIANDENHPWAGITCLGDAVIVLDEGTTNNITGGYRSPGLYVPEGKTLTLQGNGTLNATGSDYAAGIGGGYQSSCGNITIANSIGSLTATAGPSCDNAIGAGYGSSNGTITIGGVVTGNITQNPFTTFPYTVSFDANGGTGTMANQVFMYNVAQDLNANSFTRTNYRFDGWATSPNGEMVYENTQSVINLTQTAGTIVTLYATWAPASIVTLAFLSTDVELTDGNVLTGAGGGSTHVTIADGATVVLSGVDITSIVDISSHQWAGITCLGDAVIILQTGTTNSVKGGYRSPGLYVPEGKTLTIQGNGTLNATGRYNAAGIGSGYNTTCGNIILNGGTITATGSGRGAGIGSGYKNSHCGNITITNNVTNVTATAGEGCDNAIGASNSSTCGTITIGGVVTGNITQSPFVTFPYTVAFNANGGTGTMSDQSFMYNVAQNLSANTFTFSSCPFLGWATSANGPKVYNDGQSVSNLADTIATVPLYAKWSELTFTLDVEGYVDVSNPGGWYLIASPVAQSIAPSADNGFLTNAYDLYYFDHDNTGGEWRNYKATAFPLTHGMGYLYASEIGTTLTFTGTPYNGSGEWELAYNPDVSVFNGWNLVGNPYAQTASVDRDFYVMNGDRSEVIAAEGSTVEPMEGLFVVAEGADETVTFTKNTRETRHEERIVINLSRPSTGSGTGSSGVIDRAIVRFGDPPTSSGTGKPLPKFQMNSSHTKVYIPQNGKDYAIVSVSAGRDGVHTVSTMPVNFKAEHNGTYTLTFSIDNVDFDYLHLIDNLTGADVDLLVPNGGDAINRVSTYTFEAKTTDYVSRFKLVFNTDNEDGPSTGSGAFAFYSNGNWIIANEGKATLQVIDMNGRILSSETINGSISKSIHAVPGVYMIRLINGEKVWVQKIVIE